MIKEIYNHDFYKDESGTICYGDAYVVARWFEPTIFMTSPLEFVKLSCGTVYLVVYE